MEEGRRTGPTPAYSVCTSMKEHPKQSYPWWTVRVCA